MKETIADVSSASPSSERMALLGVPRPLTFKDKILKDIDTASV